jgi:predicted porin
VKVSQNAYGTGAQAGCTIAAHSTCSLEAFSFDADYHFNKHFDTYPGAMYGGVRDGVAGGYIHTTNINPTLGVRYKF